MKQIARLSAYELEQTTRSLDMQILKLERRGAHMTPPEQTRASELKRLRLQMKDKLAALGTAH